MRDQKRMLIRAGGSEVCRRRHGIAEAGAERLLILIVRVVGELRENERISRKLVVDAQAGIARDGGTPKITRAPGALERIGWARSRMSSKISSEPKHHV